MHVELKESSGDNYGDAVFPSTEWLIRVTLETLQVSETSDSGSSSPDIFQLPKKKGPVFPPQPSLDKVLLEEWKTPDKRLSFNKRINNLYPFSAEALSQWASPPTVDPPVARLSKNTVLPQGDATAFKDQADKRLDSLLKANFAATGAALRPIFAIAWVSKAMAFWGKDLSEAILNGSRKEMQVILAKILQANAYLTEAAFDAARFSGKSSAFSVAARRTLWLKLWSADQASKNLLVSIPFVGKQLFGPDLDEVLSEATGGKSTTLPQIPSKHPFFPTKARFSPYPDPFAIPRVQPLQAFETLPNLKPKQAWHNRKSAQKRKTDKPTSA
ncbi:lamina-associated polypeptide 2, isoforms alpha/zeta-like [Rhinophrynus dorsalis]